MSLSQALNQFAQNLGRYRSVVSLPDAAPACTTLHGTYRQNRQGQGRGHNRAQGTYARARATSSAPCSYVCQVEVGRFGVFIW